MNLDSAELWECFKPYTGPVSTWVISPRTERQLRNVRMSKWNRRRYLWRRAGRVLNGVHK